MTQKSNALERPELIHPYTRPLEVFLQLIDDTGGWPHSYTHVSFFHDGPDGNRRCQFTTSPVNTGGWATVCHADEYYYWKLSARKKAELAKEARQQLIKQLY